MTDEVRTAPFRSSAARAPSGGAFRRWSCIAIAAVLVVVAVVIPTQPEARAAAADDPDFTFELVGAHILGANGYIDLQKSRAPRVSDDGRFVTVVETGTTAGWGRPDWLYLYDTTTGDRQLVNSLPGDPEAGPPDGLVLEPLVSGDGSTVAFLTGEITALGPPPGETPPVYWIYLWDATTAVLEPFVVDVPAVDVWPYDLSDDGTLLLWKGDGALYVSDLRQVPSPTLRVIDNFRGSGVAQLSGDGTHVVVGDAVDEPTAGIRLFDIGSGTPQEVFRRPTSQYWYNAPTAVAIDRTGNTVAWAAGAFSETTVTVVDRTSGHELAVASQVDRFVRNDISLSADGRRLAYTMTLPQGPMGDRPTSLEMVDLENDTITEVTRVSGDGTYGTQGIDATPSLSADGTTVAFLSTNPELTGGRPGGVVVGRRIDRTAPTWVDQRLDIVDVGSTFGSVAWGAATDDRAVTGFEVSVDGTIVESTDPDVHATTVRGLEPDTAYDVSVVAVDAAGNRSTAAGASLRTLAAPAVDAPLAAVANSDGSVTLTWDPAATAPDEYAIVRTVGSDATVVGTTTDTTFEDRSTPAGVEIAYAVRAVVGDVSTPFTRTVTVRTPALPVPTITWTAARLRRTLIDVTTPIGFALQGQPGRSATATIEVERDGATDRLVAELPEVAEGRYELSWSAPPGSTRIVRVDGTLADGFGASTSAEAPGFPATYAGAVAVDVDTDAAPVGATAEVSSASALSTARRVFGDETRLLVPVVPAADHVVTLRRPDGAVAAVSDAHAVAPGAVVHVGMEYRNPATLTVDVVDPGGSPLAGVDVHVAATDAAEATVGRTGPDGRIASSGWSSRTEVQVRLTSTSVPLDGDAAVLTTLTPGENTISVVAPIVPVARIHGRIVGSEPAGAVTLTQIVSGVAVARRVTILADGTFEVAGYRGEATVSAVTASGAVGTEVVTLAAGDNAVEISAAQPGVDVVRLDLRVKLPGAETFGPPVGVDWSTAIHMGVRVVTEPGSGPVMAMGSWVDSRLSVRGEAGAVFRICADAAQAGGPSGCSDPVTLSGGGVDHDVVLRLESVAEVRAALVGPDGSPLATAWTASVSGNFRNVQLRGSGPSLATSLPAAGRYRINVSADSGRLAASLEVDVTTGVNEVAPIVLGSRGAFGTAGNTVTTTKESVLPGDLVDVRVTLAPTSAIGSASLDLALPPGWTPVDGGTTVDGAPAAVSHDGSSAVVVLGDLAAAAQRVVRVGVRVPDDQAAGVPALVVARVGAPGEASVTVGAVSFDVVGVTIAAPPTVTDRSVTASGRAPAGSTVRIDERGEAIGIALAGPDGRWEAEVELPDRPLMWTYRLAASVEVDGRTLTSGQVSVVDDPLAPRLLEVAVVQAGREVRFDPSAGVARFPYTIVQAPLEVRLRFDEPSRVSEVTVDVGQMTTSARLGADGVYVAELPMRFGQEGVIGVDYDVQRPMVRLDDPILDAPATVDALRMLLPPELRDVEVADAVAVDTDDGRAMVIDGTLPGRASTGGVAPGVRLTVSVSDPVTYTPTADDLALVQRVGLPVYGLQYHGSPDGRSGGVSARLPASEFTTSGGSFGEAGPRITGPDGRRVGAVPMTALVVAFEWVTYGDSVVSAFGMMDKYDAIEKLTAQLDAMRECLDPAVQREIDLMISDVYAAALVADGLNFAIGVAALVAAPATFGWGSLAIWAAGKALDVGMGILIDRGIADIQRRLDALRPECRPKRKPRKPVADPVYIYDPSGFVYEGVTANRLAGVTATVLYAPTASGPWEVWNAEWYGQANPLVTDDEGRYGWDVPTGFWRVRYEREGYATAYSEVLEVLPPHFDVNVAMEPLAAPRVVVRSADGAVLLDFDQFVVADRIVPVNVEVTMAGADMTGHFETVDGDTTPSGVAVARSFRFVPDTVPADGALLDVVVHTDVVNHVGRPLDAEVTAQVAFATVVEAPSDTTPTNTTPTNTTPTNTTPTNTTPTNTTPTNTTPTDTTPTNTTPSDPTPSETTAPGASTGGTSPTTTPAGGGVTSPATSTPTTVVGSPAPTVTLVPQPSPMGTLPATGADPGGLARLAWLLVVVGLVLVAVGRARAGTGQRDDSARTQCSSSQLR